MLEGYLTLSKYVKTCHWTLKAKHDNLHGQICQKTLGKISKNQDHNMHSMYAAHHISLHLLLLNIFSKLKIVKKK